MSARWILTSDDVAEWRGLSTMDGFFNVACVVFVDAETGEKRLAWAADRASKTKYGTFEKLIRTGRPLAQAEAQDVADRAIAVLSGEQPSRWFVTVKADRQLQQGDGVTRPATEIRDLDTVELDIAGSGAFRPLSVHVLSNDDAAGTILIEAIDGSIEGRLEMQLELENLERGEE